MTFAIISALVSVVVFASILLWWLRMERRYR